MEQRKIENIIFISFLVIGTLLQIYLKCAVGKSLFRYFPVWSVFVARPMFFIALFGYPTKLYIPVEATGFGLAFLMFINLNLPKIHTINWGQFATVIIIEALMFAMYFYIASMYNVTIVDEDVEI